MKEPDKSLGNYHVSVSLLSCISMVLLFNELQIAHRGSYMSAHVLLNLLNELGIKCKACRAFYLFFATSLIRA